MTIASRKSGQLAATAGSLNPKRDEIIARRIAASRNFKRVFPERSLS